MYEVTTVMSIIENSIPVVVVVVVVVFVYCFLTALYPEMTKLDEHLFQ